MDFYLDERQRKKRRRLLKLKIYIGAVVFLLLIIGGIYAVVWSPLFQAKQIVGDDNVVQELKDFFSSQSKLTEFLGANNILIWDNSKLDKFQKNPEIASITIEKDYWHREIKINVSEREKFGVWCQPSFCWWFDRNGIVFSNAASSEGNLINKVDDLSNRQLKIGDQALEGKLLSNLIKVFSVLEKVDLGIRTLKLERPELQEVSTPSTGAGPVIYFSLRFDPSFGLSAIESLKKSAGLNKLQYIDLRVENRAYYK